MKKKIKKYKGSFFDNFYVTCDKAKNMAEVEGCISEFEFNGIICRVSPDTNSERLFRDYHNAHLMEWKVVGPDCVVEYSQDVQQEYERRKKIQDENRARQEAEYREREAKERAAFEANVKGITLELRDKAGWDKTRAVNKSGYGTAALDYAEGWAKLMQKEIAKGKTVAECADETQNGLGFFGITGFQYGCGVSALSQTWKHGEELRRWHNKKYGVAEDEPGTVNPALMTLSTK